MTRLFALSLALVTFGTPVFARADETSGVAATLRQLSGDLDRAAPDDVARRLAGGTLPEARRVLGEAKELARLGRVDDARAKLRLVELRVRLVTVAVDAARLEVMARERETTALRLREEARVARAAFEQAFERRVELEHAPAAPVPAAAPPSTGRPDAVPAPNGDE